MTTNGLPEGWSYEGPDPSVGIFGEAFVHEACKLEDVQEATQSWPDSSTLRIECACGERVDLESSDPDEDPYWGDDLPDRSGEEEMLGRPLFPNEY